jgi:L-2-hydroxyglutarate oxidase LhgO
LEKYSFDLVVIGAGVVGLAVARQANLKGLSVLLVEREKSFGFGTSSRNSEVIHAGIYYPVGSLKSKLCLEGKRQLYDYCKKYNIPYKRIGKYIISCSATQTETLNQIYCTAQNAGMSELYHVAQKHIDQIGTGAKLDHALYSPSTGILNSHKFMESLVWEIEELGGTIVYNSEVTNVDISKVAPFEICINDEFLICCINLINAAGLGAVNLRNMLPVIQKGSYENCFVKGNYFGYSSKVALQRLVYPVPEKNGLGIHLTLDMNNRARFGPDTERCYALDYSVNPKLRQTFYDAVRSYWPALEIDKMYPDYSGIRPKVKYEGQEVGDFIIETHNEHKTAGLVNLLGIESPGLTSSLAIAETVSEYFQL